MTCATSLVARRPIVEERKVVTTLFCDLVAFTALSEAADPEDVERLLGEYFARATRVIESHGGVVEKFIGDAVVGVFGVPAAHEDDAERGVRAGLRLLEALEGLARPDGAPLRARVGVNTGEALVRLDVDPDSGRGFLTGDAVNVAARLQAAAPEGNVLVGALTHELTQRVIVYEKLPPVSAKGKTEPLPVWRAMEAVARTGVLVPGTASPFVGRSPELGFLDSLFERVAGSSSPQIALLVGEPGIGKTRLLQEFSARLDERPVLITWRQGRCLPFGEAVTFAPLAEIVKAHAGILESDGSAAVAIKLEAVLPEGRDCAWLRQRLRDLVGLEAPRAERDENFAAWLRFLEQVAAQGPTVLVLEDLHWADEGLLTFLEFLAHRVTEVPLLILATARPEFVEHDTEFIASARVKRLTLGSLSEGELAEIVSSVLDGQEATLAASVAARAGGNPFFAEESARLLRDPEGDRAQGSLPDSVRAVIAARLDALPMAVKTILSCAAVAGEVFWESQLVAVSEASARDVARALTQLTAKQLVVHHHSSSTAGEVELAFSHALVREVAYRELPRSRRAARHAACRRSSNHVALRTTKRVA